MNLSASCSMTLFPGLMPGCGAAALTERALFAATAGKGQKAQEMAGMGEGVGLIAEAFGEKGCSFSLRN